MERIRICAECIHWECGMFFGTGNHMTLVESKGWCLFKKNRKGEIVKRKRWNYCPACPNFMKEKRSGFIYQGGGGNTVEEDLRNIVELMDEMFDNNEECNETK